MVAIESNVDYIAHITTSPKIYKPKPKKLCITYIPYKYNLKPKKYAKNKSFLKPIISCTNYQIDKISFKEMKNDFEKLKENNKHMDNINEQKELLFLLKRTLKSDFKDNYFKERLVIKRPKKPFSEHFD